MRGELILETYEANSELALAQEKAAFGALDRADNDLSREREELAAAQHADRVARHATALRSLVDLLKAALVGGGALDAICKEDPKLTMEGFDTSASYLRHWLGLAETVLNPPPPKPLDPNMTLVRFVTSFPGRGGYGDRRSITAFSAGETAAFGRAKLAFFLELGVVELVSPDAPDEEAA